MYIPKYFLQKDTNQIFQFITENNFGILISDVDGKPWATHIPFTLIKSSGESWLMNGHISKANKQWHSFSNEKEVLIIFNGPHAYVSSSWYDHENAPTWNYIAVHVYGKLRIQNEEELKKSLSDLIQKHEAMSETPISFEAMSHEYVQKEIKGIVGLEIEITNIEAKEKLSQNRDKHNYENVIKELENRGDFNSKEIAERMKRKS